MTDGQNCVWNDVDLWEVGAVCKVFTSEINGTLAGFIRIPEASLLIDDQERRTLVFTPPPGGWWQSGEHLFVAVDQAIGLSAVGSWERIEAALNSGCVRLESPK